MGLESLASVTWPTGSVGPIIGVSGSLLPKYGTSGKNSLNKSFRAPIFAKGCNQIESLTTDPNLWGQWALKIGSWVSAANIKHIWDSFIKQKLIRTSKT